MSSEQRIIEAHDGRFAPTRGCSERVVVGVWCSA